MTLLATEREVVFDARRVQLGQSNTVQLEPGIEIGEHAKLAANHPPRVAVLLKRRSEALFIPGELSAASASHG